MLSKVQLPGEDIAYQQNHKKVKKEEHPELVLDNIGGIGIVYYYIIDGPRAQKVQHPEDQLRYVHRSRAAQYAKHRLLPVFYH